MHRPLRLVGLLTIGAALAASQACGGASDDANLFPNEDGGQTQDDAAQNGDGTTRDGASGDGSMVGDGGPIGDGGTLLDGSSGDSARADTAPPCMGLECQQTHCDGGATTTISGFVFDPAKSNPVYNAIVYVPNAMVPDLPQGPSCDVCGAHAPGGQPITVTLSKADGSFTLPNVPAGANIPLVVQIGKWRRVTTVTQVNACTDNVVDKEVTRLPKTKAEGSIPQIAIATGGCDQLECLLRKMGVDDTEFTAPTGTGRIHIYQGDSGGTVAGSPAATTLWSSATQLAKYDLVLNGCECMATEQEKPRASLQNMATYAANGGRWLGTHYQNYWLEQGPFPLPYTATFHDDDGFAADSLTLNVNTAFPKGAAFAAWLVATGASTTLGSVTIDSMRHNVSASNAPSSSWLTGNDQGSSPAAEVALYTFNAPYPTSGVSLDAGGPDAIAPWGDAGSGPACGKIAYADFHATYNAIPAAFPGECDTTAMTNDEKALEFTLFDLGACVQDDTQAPQPPPLH